jgi:hypothetical protein
LEKAATRSILVDRPVLAGEVGNRTLFRQLTCDSARFFLIRFAEPGFGSKEVIYFKPREIPSIALNFEDIQETRAISNGAMAREEVDSIFPLRLLQVGELAVSLVDQVRRSERVTTPLGPPGVASPVGAALYRGVSPSAAVGSAPRAASGN